MWVRVLPIAQNRKEDRVEKCEKHMIVKGEVERSTKENGMAIRKRRCDVCGDLIRTVEMTEDQLDFKMSKFEDKNRELRSKLVYYKTVVEHVQRMFDMVSRIKDELEMQSEISEQDQLE